MESIAMPVTIIVKAPNQQIEDQTIHCELDWTIKRLKGYLSEVYPSKPRLEDQKLIYSGQLLVDTVQLKDVLRSYDGQENHTVHLVCSPPRDSYYKSSGITSNKNKNNIASTSGTVTSTTVSNSSSNSSTNSNSSANIRNNNINSRLNVHARSETEPLLQNSRDDRRPGGDPRGLWVAAAAAAASYPNVGAYNGANVAHQMAWMQQCYSQYVNHYMQLMASTQSGSNPAAAAAARMAYPMGFNGFNAPPGMAPGMPAQFNSHQHINDVQQPQPPNAVAANNQQQQEDEEEGRGNRDWLDWFYIMSRVLVLFSIIYFYSSPVRFLMVTTLGMIMYLYQIGFFRMQGLEAGRGGDVAINNNGNVANLAAAAPERDNNNDRQNPEAVAAAANFTADTLPGANDNINNNSSEHDQQDVDTPPPHPVEPERPSFLTLTWTILCSFLLSLIPEQPNVI